MKISLLIGFFVISLSTFGQEFSFAELESVSVLKSNFQSHFKVREVKAVSKKDSVGYVCIPNALRRSSFINTEAWLRIKDTVTVEKIEIVFSKYPIRDETYTMYFPLLKNRIVNLFKLDLKLNDTLIDWHILLQTNCHNDETADALFHGVRIHYLVPKENLNRADTTVVLKLEIDSVASLKLDNDEEAIVYERALEETYADQGGVEALKSNLDFIEADLPEDVKLQLKDKSVNQRLSITKNYFENLLDTLPEVKRHKVDEAYLNAHRKKVESFVKRYCDIHSTSTISVIFDKHPEWKKSLVVADWTGSMYKYGAQVLLWHIDNFESSGVNYFTLFNDGNHKLIKKIGKTGGIYHEKADNIERLVGLYNLVQMRGGGGDGPENDIEAILDGMTQYPNHDEIILIADNNACVRDIELANLIGKPVRIVLCGYDSKIGINPDYLMLASSTKGSIHTIESDILYEDIDSYRDIKGTSHFCSQYNYLESLIIKDFKFAKENWYYVKHLSLTGQGLNKMPNNVNKLSSLVTLNLSENNISRIGGSILNLRVLQELNLSNNQLKKYESSLNKAKYLVKLDLSYNNISKVDYSISFSHLKSLNLSHNSFTSINGIQCKSLVSLDLSNNQLKNIPKGFRYSKNLKQLNLSNNPLKLLSDEVRYMKKLEVIDLTNCGLTSLGKNFYKMRKLKVVKLSGNYIPEKEIKLLKQILPEIEIIY